MARLLDVRDFGIYYELAPLSPADQAFRVFVPWSSIRKMSLAEDADLVADMEDREDREAKRRELRGEEEPP